MQNRPLRGNGNHDLNRTAEALAGGCDDVARDAAVGRFADIGAQHVFRKSLRDLLKVSCLGNQLLPRGSFSCLGVSLGHGRRERIDNSERAGDYETDHNQYDDRFNDTLFFTHAATPPNGFVSVQRDR